MVKLSNDYLEYVESKAGRKLTEEEIRAAEEAGDKTAERWKNAGNNMMATGCGMTIVSLLALILIVLI